jgi:hypothetical protein
MNIAKFKKNKEIILSDQQSNYKKNNRRKRYLRFRITRKKTKRRISLFSNKLRYLRRQIHGGHA